MNRTSMTRLIPLILVGALLSACGGESACEKAGNKLCAKACACTSTDGMCRIGDTMGYLSVENESDCKGLFVTFGCMGDNPNIDFEACSAALDTVACVDLGDGNQ